MDQFDRWFVIKIWFTGTQPEVNTICAIVCNITVFTNSVSEESSI